MAKQWPLKVENVTYHWPQQFITGADIRQLGPGIPANMDLYLKRAGKPGVLIENDSAPIDLDEKGLEKFYAQDSSSEAGF
jgi:hypothetical protein